MMMRGLSLLLLVMLSGCAGFNAIDKAVNSPEKQFQKANTDFMQRLRWHDFNGAAAHVTEPNQQKFKDLFLVEQDLKITDVRLESADVSADGTQVDSWVVVEYYRLPSLTIKTFKYAQRWTFFDKDDVTPVGWKITSVAPPLP